MISYMIICRKINIYHLCLCLTMQRKVIKLGQNSLLISLPSKWVKQHGISKGSEVNVEVTPQYVLISSPKTMQKTKSLQLSDDPKLASRQVNIAYKRGVDELELNYTNPKSYEAVLEELQYLIGFEVVESRKHSCRIKNIASGEMGDLNTVLRRAFLALLEMAESTEEHAKTKSADAAEHVALSEKTLDKLTDFCKRLLNKHGAADIPTTTMLYGVLKEIEHVADHYSELVHAPINKELLPVLSETKAQLRDLYELFYNFDKERASSWLVKIKNAETAARSVLNKNPLATHHVLAIIQTLNEMSWPVYAKALYES